MRAAFRATMPGSLETRVFPHKGVHLALGVGLGLCSVAGLGGCANKRDTTHSPSEYAGSDGLVSTQQLGTAADEGRRQSRPSHKSHSNRGDVGEVAEHAEYGEVDDQVARADASARNPVPAPSLGTSYGERLTSHVVETVFERRDEQRPAVTFELGYDDPAGAFAPYAPWSRELPTTTASVGHGGLFVTLVDERGIALPATHPPNRGHITAIGAVDQRYELVVHNDTNQRFEVVISVDGLDVIDGTSASYAHDGYVIDPHATLQVAGWRTDYDGVAAFRFSDVPESYGGQTGRPHNVGVIGLAFFEERPTRAYASEADERRWSPRPYTTAPDPFPAN